MQKRIKILVGVLLLSFIAAVVKKDPDGAYTVVWFEGELQAFIDDLKKRKAADSYQPHRIKYKALVRG